MNKKSLFTALSFLTLVFISCSLNTNNQTPKDNSSLTIDDSIATPNLITNLTPMLTISIAPSVAPSTDSSMTKKITSELNVSILPEDNTLVEEKESEDNYNKNDNISAEKDGNIFKNTYAENILPPFEYGTFKEWAAADTMDYFFYTDISVEEILCYIENVIEEGFVQISFANEYKSSGELTFCGKNSEDLIVEIRLIQGDARIAIGIKDLVH